MSDSSAPDKKPVPREFHSEYEGRPFRNCSHCGEPLAAFSNYQINKAWRNNECVFEYVFCEECRERMLESFSLESKQRLMQHQEKHLRDVHGTAECAFCGSSRAGTAMQDYIVTALCSGEHLLDSIMICEPCQLITHELLSDQTRDVRRRFFEDLPGIPPDWEGLPIPEHGREPVTTHASSPSPYVAKVPAGIALDAHHDPACLMACVELIWAPKSS